MKRPARRKRGQALIETALIGILICMLFGGALDFGLAYFTFQSLSNAALEGVSYGSMEPMKGTAKNDTEIQLRVRNEPGPSTLSHRVRPVNLRDLDNDGTIDEPTDDISSRIQVGAVAHPGSGWTDAHCSSYRPIGGCDITVTMSYRYVPFFGRLIGVNEIDIEVTRSEPIHE
jgi:hypothetical protein